MKMFKLVCCLWRPVLVKIMTIKLHRESILIQLQQILWTFCAFLSSLNNAFFILLVIIFSNKSYFCINYTNTLFIHSMNYFSVVPRITFLMCQGLFFNWAENYFFQYREFIFWSTVHCGPCIWSGLVLSLWPPLTILKTLQVEEYFQRECQGETLSEKETKEVFIFLTKSVRS